MAADSFDHLGTRITLQARRDGRYKMEFYQTQLCLQWDGLAKMKGKVAARAEAEGQAKWYHENMERLVSERAARADRDLIDLQAAMPAGALEAVRYAHALPDAPEVNRAVCRLWAQTDLAFRRLLDMEASAPISSTRAVVDALMPPIPLPLSYAHRWFDTDVDTAVRKVLRSALEAKFCA